MASTATILDYQEPTPTPTLELPLLSPGPLGANRRFTPRLNTRFIVRPKDGGPSYEGVDISFGGLMCTGGDPTWPGNTMELDLILPGEHTALSVRGRVVELVSYRNRVAMRVRFDGISLADRKRIAAWMARRTQL